MKKTKLIAFFFLLLVLSLSAEEIVYLCGVNNDSIPALYQCCAAFDSTGRLWASGVGIFDSKPLYSFDGISWEEHGVFEDLHQLFVDVHNNLWFYEWFVGANLNSYKEGVLTEYAYCTSSLGIDPGKGKLCFFGGPYPIHSAETGLWEYQDSIMHNRFLRDTYFHFLFGLNGEYLCLSWAGEYVLFQLRDSIDNILSSTDTFDFEIRTPITRSTEMFSNTDSMFYFVVELGSRKEGILRYNLGTVEIDSIDTCSRGKISAIFEDSEGTFYYSLSSSNCRDDGVYVYRDDEIFFIDHIDSTGRCNFILEDPYTHNIWLCCRDGFVIYNRDSVWFDIHEYSVEEKPQPIAKHQKLQVYPNPTRGKCYIDGSIENPVSVYNLNGRLIDKILPGSNYWDSENQPTGTYLFRSIRDSSTASAKIKRIN